MYVYKSTYDTYIHVCVCVCVCVCLSIGTEVAHTLATDIVPGFKHRPPHIYVYAIL
jgi:hypothetical protein